MGATALQDEVTMILENEIGEVIEQVKLYVKSPSTSPSEIVEFYVDTPEGNARFQLGRYQTASFISLPGKALAEALI